MTLLQVREFSRLPGERVEAVVRPREPLDDGGDNAGIVKLAGEDALLDWPNAIGHGACVELISVHMLGCQCTVVSASVRARECRIQVKVRV